MERLTGRNEYGFAYYKHCFRKDTCMLQTTREKCAYCEYEYNYCNKLAEYEDLEEQLEKVYGENDGLLETVVNSLIKFNGGQPRKSRLLTDEDADKWEEYKTLEEQGLLIRLPCKVGDKIYKLWPCGKNGKTVAEFEIAHIDVDFLPEIEFSFCKHKGSGSYYFAKASEIGKTVFLTREEAEAALERMSEK